VFLKPPNRKTFPARVHASGAELPELPDDDLVLVAAEPVEWDAEFRSWGREAGDVFNRVARALLDFDDPAIPATVRRLRSRQKRESSPITTVWRVPRVVFS
jgi:hypothetical protein